MAEVKLSQIRRLYRSTWSTSYTDAAMLAFAAIT